MTDPKDTEVEELLMQKDDDACAPTLSVGVSDTVNEAQDNGIEAPEADAEVNAEKPDIQNASDETETQASSETDSDGSAGQTADLMPENDGNNADDNADEAADAPLLPDSDGDGQEETGVQEEPGDVIGDIASLADDNKTFCDKAEADDKYDPEHPRRVDNRFDFAELFVFTFVIVLLLTTFVFRHSVVDGGSMENTLHNGEHLIISDAFYSPKRGDVIVCEDYSTGLRKPIVKRIIALGGDTVEITADKVYVNGEELTEDYVNIDSDVYVYTPMSCTVPEGEVFVMGDHRNNSSDSRVFGTVREDAILGKVIVRFYPFDKFGKIE